VLDQALDGAYRRIAFFPSNRTAAETEEIEEDEREVEEEEERTAVTLSPFFEDIGSVVEDTMVHLLEEPSDLKVCSHLTLRVWHKSGDGGGSGGGGGFGSLQEKSEITHLCLKATPLTDMQHHPENMQRQF